MKVILAAVFMMLLTTPSFADDNGYLHGPAAEKIKRGAINLLTAPVEIPKKIKEEWDKSGPHIAEKAVHAFGGSVKGIAYSIGRLGSGLWDVLTFNLDIPANGQPLMKPDFVFSEKDD